MKERTKDKIAKWTILVIAITLVLVLIWASIGGYYQAQDKPCKQMGYNHTTDIHSSTYPDTVRMIECDGTAIYYEMDCERNKWNEETNNCTAKRIGKVK